MSKATKAVLYLRVPVSLHRQLATLARREHRSLTAQAELLIQQGLEASKQ